MSEHDPSLLYDRPIPDGIVLDEQGLLESWLFEVEDWLIAYEGPEHLTPAEAFEGIELLGRLSRVEAERLALNEGMAVLQELRTNIEASADRFIDKAVLLPDLDAWMRQARTAWENEIEDEQLAITLLRDAEAIDLLFWFAESHGASVHQRADLQSLFQTRNEVQLWLGQHAVYFILCEGYLRAVCRMFSDKMSFDPTGWLDLSAAMYLPLLDAADQGWRDTESIVAADVNQLRFPGVSAPLGSSSIDYRHLPVAASAAGAATVFQSPVQPYVWHDRASQWEAVFYRPTSLQPDGKTEIEILFFGGEDKDTPAKSLVGSSVRLGNASGVIEIRSKEGFETTFAVLVHEMIVAGQTSKVVELRVDDELWEQ